MSDVPRTTTTDLKVVVGQILGSPEAGIAAVDAVRRAIVAELCAGRTVSIAHLGLFETVHQPRRIEQNQRTREEFEVQARTVARFRTGKSLNVVVNNAAVVRAEEAAAQAVRGGER